MTEASITVALADDHNIVRQGLRKLLEAEKDLEVVGEASDGFEAAQMVESVHPDILVVDVMMPGMNGLEVTRQVRKRSPKTRVIVLSMHADNGYVLEALRAGAKGYVLKESVVGDLIQAIRQAIAGRRYLSNSLSERAIEGYMRQSESSSLEPMDLLTLREKEVLHLVAQGLRNNQIAQRLSISRRTVEMHRANLMRKLGLRSQAQLLRYALNQGMLSLNQ